MLLLERPSGRVLYANRQLWSDLCTEPPVLNGQTFHGFFWPEFAAMLQNLLDNCTRQNNCTQVYYWAERALWGKVSATAVQWQNELDAMLVTITNITEISRSEYEYKHMAYYDPQLELPNGLKLEEDIRALASFERVALIHFDIDRFSSINDLFGWDAGDYLLVQVRDWLLHTARTSCVLYRVGDDEFCMLIRDISKQDAEARAQGVLERFKSPWKLPPGEHSLPLYCTVSLGVVYGSFIQGDMRNLLFRTAAPPDRVRGYSLYDAEMDRDVQRKLLLRQNLINCVQDDMRGFSVCFQPIISTATGRWAGAEALCRWTMPGGDTASPQTFIGEAERLGLIAQLDDWVLHTAVSQCVKWGLHQKEFFLDVNVSPLQKIDDGYAARLLQTLQQCGYPSEKLYLEITESNKFDFSHDNMQRWNRLYLEGIRISLDDFGTGYSSFHNLLSLPASVLKTEKIFIDNLVQDDYLQYLLQMMVNLAHRAGMRIVVEGVETEAQQRLLCQYGVDYMQGYLFSRPLAADELEKKLSLFC